MQYVAGGVRADCGYLAQARVLLAPASRASGTLVQRAHAESHGVHLGRPLAAAEPEATAGLQLLPGRSQKTTAAETRQIVAGM